MRIRLLSALAVLAAALPLLAGEASGSFTVTKKPPIKPKYAAAYETHDQRDAKKVAIEVVLSDAQVDVKAAVEDLDPHTNLINQSALQGHNYILLWVRPGNDVSMNATYSETMSQFIDMTGSIGSLQAEITTYTADKVAGHVWTPKPVTSSDGTSYSVDVKFSADIAHPPAGTKLAPDGGEPGKALKALLDAMKKKNFAAIKAGVTARHAEMFSDVNDAIESLNIFLPKPPMKIRGGELRGDMAILQIESELFPGQKGLTLVQMMKSGTKWQFERATRAGLID
jgi:hypothetical protein